MRDLPEHDAIYVISDLHLGGEPGFQIFNQGQLLGDWIRQLARERPQARVALVLNGDIVDFLAEERASYFDAERALGRLQRIVEKDVAFRAVWEALQGFVRTPCRTLVLAIGNHDLELALPAVRHWLIEHLAGGDDAARGRIVIALDGAGYACEVGRKRVLCVHGNEVDPWNVVDHEALRKVGEALQRGREPEPWKPNAGTRLVIDVMNGIKRTYPFVDVLKPEREGVLNLLLWLAPERTKKLLQMPAIGIRYVRGLFSRRHLLGDEVGEGEEVPVMDEGLALIHEQAARRAVVSSAGSTEELLRQVEEHFAAGEEPVKLSRKQGAEGTLGHGQAIVDLAMGKPREEVLRKALLDWLEGDRSFDVTAASADDLAIHRSVGAEIHYLVAGHTHLARALSRETGRYYYNSGTWARLLEIPKDVLEDTQRFQKIYQALTGLEMKTLDHAELDGERKLIRLRPTVVCIEAFEGEAAGRLAEAVREGGNRIELKPLRTDCQIDADPTRPLAGK